MTTFPPTPVRPDPSAGEGTTSFGCDDCSRQASEHCSDCVLAYLCSDDAGAMVVSLDELRVVKRLQSVGLAPPLRHSAQHMRGSNAG